MAATLAALLRSLDLDEVGPDRFTGRSAAAGWPRVFGGSTFAQATVAAARTAGGRPAHALHGTFLLPGDPDEPFAFAVERTRDGGSFAARRCVASQHGRAVFALTASFQAAEAGALDRGAAMPEAGSPDGLEPLAGAAGAPAAMGSFLRRHAAVELRSAGRAPGRPSQAVWMRAAGPMPDDPALHAAVLAYMADATLLDAALLAAGRSVFDGDVQAASLDHALWLHRPARADGWTLHIQEGVSVAGGRAFARGSLFSRDGRLVGSTAQEGLARLRAPE